MTTELAQVEPTEEELEAERVEDVCLKVFDGEPVTEEEITLLSHAYVNERSLREIHQDESDWWKEKAEGYRAALHIATKPHLFLEEGFLEDDGERIVSIEGETEESDKAVTEGAVRVLLSLVDFSRFALCLGAILLIIWWGHH